MSALRSFLAGIVLSAGAFAGTIVSHDALPSLVGYAPGWQAVSWTQSATYTNVTVSALEATTIAFNQSTGTAYLLNHLGPGTTAANQLAAPVNFTTNGSLTQLFSGLTLGPGTYYLLIDSVQGQAGWGQTNFGGVTEVLDAGVSNILQYGNTGPVQAYSPSTAISSYDPKVSGSTFIFNATGDRQGTSAAPEPTSVALALGGLAVLMAARRKR